MMKAGLSTTPAEEVPDGGFVDADFTPMKANDGARQQRQETAEETDADFIDRHTKAILALKTPEACDAWYQANGQAIKDRLPPEMGSPLFAKLKQRRDALASQQADNPFEDAA
jgi:hypothetical protein